MVDIWHRQNVEQVGRVIINGEVFYGIGYQGLLTINTKTYQTEPTRSNDGSMENIKDAQTFIVPRCKVNFKYFNINDYVRLCNAIRYDNEFPVTYYDKEYKQYVTNLMYIEPQEAIKIYNCGTSIIGVLDYEVSFIGTLNDIRENQTLTLKANGGTLVDDLETEIVVPYMTKITMPKRNEVFTKYGYVLNGWSEQANGNGLNFYNGEKVPLVSNLTLYAQWRELGEEDYVPFITADNKEFFTKDSKQFKVLDRGL